MPANGIKTIATSRNGVGAFIRQCKRLDFHYCDYWGSSRGMNALLKSRLLASFARAHPQVEICISPRPNRHPALRAFYINGRAKEVCVRNLDARQILLKAQLLTQNSGDKNRPIRGKNVLSANDNVRGMWSPFHGGITAV